MRFAWITFLTGCGSLVYYDKPAPPTLPTPTDPSSDPPAQLDTGAPPEPGATTDTGAEPDPEPAPTTTDTGDPVTGPSTTTDGSTTTAACTYPSNTVFASSGAYTMPNPAWVGLAVYGIASGHALYDYDAAGAPYSAVAVFSFYDGYGFFLCDIAYDASGAVPAFGWTTDSGGALYEAWDLVLANGQSSCGTVNGQDLRNVVESYAWGVGVGQLVGLASYLQYVVSVTGGDWANDWAPYTYGLYAEGGLWGAPGAAVEAGWAQSLDRDCATVLTDAYGYGFALPTPVGGPLEEYVTSQPLLITQFPTL